MPKRSRPQLVTFPNPKPGREYVIRHECSEYTALCPVTGQPDFGAISLLGATPATLSPMPRPCNMASP